MKSYMDYSIAVFLRSGPSTSIHYHGNNVGL